MNILLINVNIGRGWGGIESHSDMLAETLTAIGHKVVLGCWVDGSVTVGTGTVLPSQRITIRNSGDFRAVAKIIRVCRDWDINLIIANGGREYWPAALAAKFLGKKIILVRHQTDRIRATTRWLIHSNVKAVIAVSGAVRQALITSGIKQDKIALIYNCISLSKFNPSLTNRQEIREELAIDKSECLIGTIGKLHRGKGVYELLRAVGTVMKLAGSVRLVFVGDGEEKEGLVKEAERLGIRDNLIFTGVRRDVERIYAAMDIFVLASTCEEAFGMVLIEAMAMGKPVIGTMVGGIPDIIKDGLNGLLVPPGDDRALSRAILRYIDDPELAARAASEGRRTVEQEFSESVMGERFEGLFHTLGLT